MKGKLAKHVLTGLFAALFAANPAVANPDDPVGTAYGHYREAISSARHIVNSSGGIRPGHEAEDRGEGELFVRSIINASIIWALIKTPDHPIAALVPHPDDRLGFNNPDNLYYTARFADERGYVITGNRGLARTFAIQGNAGLPGLTNEKGMTLSYINGRDLKLDDDGGFTISLSPDAPRDGSNWLELKPGVDNLLVRFSFQDWETEHARPGSIAIALADIANPAPVEITPALASEMLEDAATSIREQAELYSRSWEAAKARGTNSIVGPLKGDASQATASHQWNMIGTFELERDEAMVVTVKDAPQSLYYNFEVANPWLNTFEFVRHQSSLNRSQVRIDDDGYIRFVVSPEDPGAPNWIDTTGRTQGWIWSRWQEVEGEIGPEYTPKVEVVKRSDVQAVLPPGTPLVTPEQRKAVLAERTRQLKDRFANADPERPEILRRLRAVETLVGEKLAEVTIDDALIN